MPTGSESGVGRGPSARARDTANTFASPKTSRRERKKQRTRRQIFRAALELFEEQGVEAVRIEQICERADVAKATFFLHFPSRSALLTERALELAAELSASLPDPRTTAAAELRAVLGQLSECRSPELTAAVLREGGEALRGLLHDIVERGQRRGELRRDVSPQLVAAALLASAGAVIGERGSSLPPAERTGQLLAITLSGLLEPKPRLKWSPARSGSSGGAGS
jgi:AcrR family transcriptional regulator